MKKVKVGDFWLGQDEKLAVISGPCVIESEESALGTAEFLKRLFEKSSCHFIFKSSYDKANRSSRTSFRGPGLEKGLRILERVKQEFDVPVLTDVHSVSEAIAAAQVCDVLQIPAFLCRQTDLIIAAAQTGRVVNVKKGQFMAPLDMKNVVEKILEEGNERILLTDRGTSFGYNNLVCDMRAIPQMQQLGFPVVFDATHGVQLPGAQGKCSGGQREFIPALSKAALGAGCNALFVEAHPCPEKAKSDAATQLSFSELQLLVPQWDRLYEALHSDLLAYS